MSQHTRASRGARATAAASTTMTTKTAATATTTVPPCTLADVGVVLQRVHRSAAHAQRCKKEMLSLLLLPPTTSSSVEDGHEATTSTTAAAPPTAAAAAAATTAAPHTPRPGGIESMCEVVVLVLQQVPVITPDALRRHYSFVGELCRAYREAAASDALSVALLHTLRPLHNAQDKAVRLAVVTLLEVVLRTVDARDTSDERQDLYQHLAELLKCRLHDRCAAVRERAVAAAAAFQTGRRDCDVTAQLVALLCSDTHAEVRRRVLRCVAPRKEFLEGYFHSLVRCSRDVVARVRGEAWDALGRFAWRYVVAYATAKRVALLAVLHDGLRDTNASVVVACTATLTSCWLHRDCRDDCSALLEAMCGGATLPSALDAVDAVCAALLAYCRRRTPQRRFALPLQDVHLAALLMWRAECLLCCGEDAVEGAEDEAMAAVEGGGGVVGVLATTATATTTATNATAVNNNTTTTTPSSLLLLPPLETFAALLQDTMYAYAKPDTPPTMVRFRSTDDADHMLRVVLATVDLYDDNGYLAHTDNTTRHALLRLLGFLLKVVPDDEPALFVEGAVRAVRALTLRTPDEATRTVTGALDSLFRSLRLPQRYGLGFDDLEALGRKSRERQQELARRKARLVVSLRTTQAQQRGHDDDNDGDDNNNRDATSSTTTMTAAQLQRAYDELREEMDRDEKFLLRMQHIVLAYLAYSQRGDAVPPFCSHVMQLGRQQDHARVRAVATRSLGLMCMIAPETVHTFVPLLYADAHDHTAVLPLATTSATTAAGARDAAAVAAAESVPVAALGALFDLVMEYGLGFFSTPTRTTTTTAAATAAVASNLSSDDEQRQQRQHATTSYSDEGVVAQHDTLDARLQREHEVADEDVHKVGSTRLLRGLLSCLSLPHTDTASDTDSDTAAATVAAAAAVVRVPVALVGFCKLLSCNRVPSERVPLVLAMLTLHRTRAYMTRKTGTLAAYTCDYLSTFLRSYAASHTRRQGYCVVAAAAALRALLCDTRDGSNDSNSNSRRAWSLALMQHMTRITDAFVLTHIRDIDPDTAKHVAATTAANVSSSNVNNGNDADTTSGGGSHHQQQYSSNGNNGDGDAAGGSTTRNTTSRVTVTRSSMQSGRLLRELSRCSQHEQLACELLIEVAVQEAAEARAVCLEVLERYMYFYAKDAQPFLAYCATRALAALAASAATALQTRLQTWLDDVRRCTTALSTSAAAAAAGGGAADDRATAQLEDKWQACLRQRGEMLDELRAAGLDARLVGTSHDVAVAADKSSNSNSGLDSGRRNDATAAAARVRNNNNNNNNNTATTTAAVRVKDERVAVKRERDSASDYFGVESIVRTRTARPRR